MLFSLLSFLKTLKPSEWITVIGILATFAVSLFTLKYSKKQRFISSITKMRCEYLENMKRYIAGFISECSKVITDKKTKKEEIDYNKLHEMYSLIILNLSSTHRFDIEYQRYLASIYENMLGDYPSLAVFDITKLIDLSRKLIKMEWEGIKYEIQKGHVATGNDKIKLEETWLFPDDN
jgi:hypothetical protein